MRLWLLRVLGAHVLAMLAIEQGLVDVDMQVWARCITGKVAEIRPLLLLPVLHFGWATVHLVSRIVVVMYAHLSAGGSKHGARAFFFLLAAFLSIQKTT